MSSLTRRGERSGGEHWSAEVQHHCGTLGVKGRDRPAPEGAGAGGFRSDAHPCSSRAEPGGPSSSSYRSLPGAVGDRIRSTMWFGAGTMCRGSAGSASPGRDQRKVGSCEKCSATLVSLKKQALSLAVHHHFSCKDSGDLSAFLNDNIRVHREREQGQCSACGTILNHLKQEAVHLALNRGQALAKPAFEPGFGRPLGQGETKQGDLGGHQPYGRTHSPLAPQSPRTPQRTPQTLRRRGPKPTNPDMDRWVEEQQHLVACKSASNADGVTSRSYRQAADDATLSCGGAGTVQSSSKLPHISRVVNIANTAAMSLLARAAEKLNLTLRKKGQASDPTPAHFSTCFREMIQKQPPPVPSCLLQAATRTKDSPSVGKVKVVLRVSPTLSGGRGQPPVLHIDPSQRKVTIMEPVSKSQSHSNLLLGRDGRNLLKTFNFDTVYPQETSQAEVSAGVLADVIRCVLSGSDGCVLGLGCADVGSWSSTVGSDESTQRLGLIPCAISWLYSAIERRREKTWTDLTVSVSAIELCCGEEDTLRDLLGEVVPSVGSNQDSPRARVRLQEDPVYGIQLRNHNRVKAPTAERAASLLDAAITARRHSDFITYLSHTSIMLFTLHVQPPRTESSTIGKGSRGATKLTMIDVCSGMRGMSRTKPPYSELGSVIMSLLSGHKTIHNKGSKLTMLLRESLGHINCHTTVMAEVADSLAHLQETFSIIQLASRIRRTQRRTKQSSSCSPSGRSLTREKRGPQSFSLRAFHSTDEVDVDHHPFRLRGDLDDQSSSEQSCDTVIKIDSDGFIHSKAPPRLMQPEFVPIIPSLHPNKADLDDPEFTALLQELLRIPQLQVDKKKEEALQGHMELLKADAKPPERDCLKCETFAELQERLGCIDGSELIMDVLKSSSKGPPANNVPTKSQPKKEAGKQTDTKSSPQRSNQGLACCQSSDAERKTDGDSFQREDSGLYDCEECSATSSSEELLNQAHSLNMTCQPEPPSTGTAKSGCKRTNVDTQGTPKKNLNAPSQPAGKQESPESADWFKTDKRASPIGKSSPMSPPSMCSSPRSLATSVIHGDVLSTSPKGDSKEMKATITVTVKQPLDLKGQDELVFSMVEEVTISGALTSEGAGGNIMCIRDAAQAHAQGSASSQPIRIISNVSEDSTASGSSNTTKGTAVQPVATDGTTDKPQYQPRKERGFLPSFINPMLINTDVDCELDDGNEKETPSSNTYQRSGSEEKRSNARTPEKTQEKKSASLGPETHVKISDKQHDSAHLKPSCDTTVTEGSASPSDTTDNRVGGKRQRDTERGHPRDREHVYSPHFNGCSEAGDSICKCVGNAPKRVGVVPGCQETAPVSYQTGSLHRDWPNASQQVCHMSENHRDPRGVIPYTTCSPGATLERRQGRQNSSGNHSPHFSSPLKCVTENKYEVEGASRKGVGSMLGTSGLRLKHDDKIGRSQSPIESTGRLFSAKLEQLALRTNSLGRLPRDFPALHRGSSNHSMSSKGSSKGSTDGSGNGVFRDNNEGHFTLPRANRSPRKSHRSDQNPHCFSSENPASSQSAKHSHHKLSAVGKLKMATPKVRRLSASSIKNLSLSNKGIRQSSSRSASLSPDSKSVSFERTSSFLSSSPPRSYQSISRTPSQSSTCSSTKSAIQGFVNGRISDLLKERAPSPNLAGMEEMTPVPSPYSQVTAPRTPDHLSGHASDTTSVLSGDLPPAMGKTSLYFSHRNSMVSSGYDSMVRDSETTASSTSNRDSVSDRSNSLLSVGRSSRSSRRKGSTGTHQRRPSQDSASSLQRSTSGLRSRWVDRGIPEAYEIKVYEIDTAQKMQKRAGAGKQGPACFSAKLKFLEHRQQRISDVRAKYNNLRKELEQLKHNLMLEPTKWNQEFDLWQTFDVDSLEHLEALEAVTAQLENRVARCRANIMMVTCFDVAIRRRSKKTRRKASEQGGAMGT